MNEANDFLTLYDRVSQWRLPHWDELPDLELYMDQVLSLMDRYLGGYPDFAQKGLTASMVNNYVKLGVMPPPVKKKYTRLHLAYLIAICALKTCLPIDCIKTMIASTKQMEEGKVGYDRFCAMFEEALQETAAEADGQAKAAREEGWYPTLMIYRAALRAQAERQLSLKLYEAAFAQAEKKE